jgi:hypothetical protein
VNQEEVRYIESERHPAEHDEQLFGGTRDAVRKRTQNGRWTQWPLWVALHSQMTFHLGPMLWHTAIRTPMAKVAGRPTHCKAGQNTHAGADGPDHLHGDVNLSAGLCHSANRKRSQCGYNEYFHKDQPHSSSKEEACHLAPVLSSCQQTGANACEQHKYWCTEVSNPAR